MNFEFVGKRWAFKKMDTDRQESRVTEVSVTSVGNYKSRSPVKYRDKGMNTFF
jgi:hypothetical protein